MHNQTLHHVHARCMHVARVHDVRERVCALCDVLCARVCVCAVLCVCAFVRARVRACVHLCVHLCVRVCVSRHALHV